MAKINFVVPRISKHKFAGGIWCILEYASGLHARGHDVTIVPVAPSDKPLWFPRPYGTVLTAPLGSRLVHVTSAFCRFVAALLRGALKADVARALPAARELLRCVFLLAGPALPYVFRRSVALAYLEQSIPPADVTIATSFDTALPVAIFGTGEKHYFVQHFEPYFRDESSDPEIAEFDARLSYTLGLRTIANSTWLRNVIIGEVPNVKASICPNAVDHTVFRGAAKQRTQSKEIKLISYGGRNAKWKGFADMAAAVAIARKELPDVRLRWLVYGDAMLPPNNPVAAYESLGFLSPGDLAAAYRGADVLLSASWYESFPLFPLEAMACGLPVITTQKGTEEYAVHGETAEIVEPRNPQSIAAGIVHLVRDANYSFEIATRGNTRSRQFTWDRSVENMERLIVGKQTPSSAPVFGPISE